MRRINVIAVVIGLMALGIAPVREALVGYWWSAPVQSFIQPYVDEATNRGAVATSALIQFVRAHPIKFVNGLPVTTITSSSGTRTVSLDTADNWSLDHGCSLSGDEVEAILKGYNSPAVGIGQASVEFCEKYGIDNAYWLAQFVHESTAGTAGAAVETANTGNIIGSYNGHQKGRFRDYQGDWKAGAEQHFQLLACYQSGGAESFCNGLYSGKKHNTIVEAIYTWAPPEDSNNQEQDCEKDPGSYPCAVKRDVSNWRAAHTTVATTTNGDLRAKIIEKALSLQGTQYSQAYNGALGFRPDCSGTVAFIYKDVAGLNIGSTTYDIYPNLTPIELEQVQPGDLWFGQWPGSPPNNEHVGIVADVNGDGKLDLIHNGADKAEQHVTESFLETYLGQHTKGFRTALGK